MVSPFGTGRCRPYRAAGLYDPAVRGATDFDEQVLDWVVARRSAALTTGFKAVTELGDAALLFPLTVVIVVFLVAARRFWLAAFFGVASIGGMLLQGVLKEIWMRPRPPASVYLVPTDGYSFPSGHTFQAASTWFALAVVATVLTQVRWMRIAAWVTASVVVFLVGCSRVYLGVHWATDVLGGWCIGALWVGLLVLMFRSRFATPRVQVAG